MKHGYVSSHKTSFFQGVEKIVPPTASLSSAHQFGETQAECGICQPS